MPVRNQRNVEPATGLDEHLLELYRRSRAEEFGIAAPSFAAMLYELAAKNIPEAPKSQRLDFSTACMWKIWRSRGLALAATSAPGRCLCFASASSCTMPVAKLPAMTR